MNTSFVRFAGCTAVGIALVSTLSAAPDRPWTLNIEALSSPAGAESSAPQLTTAGDRVILSWMERAGSTAALKFAERTAGGWSAARTAATGKDLIVNSADVPSVKALSDGTLVAHWLQENGPDPEAYNLRLAWSKDGGATWSQPVSPHHDGTQTQHGFASLFDAPGGGLGLVWLDGRATNPDSPNATDNMSLRTTVYGKDFRQLRETAIDTRVCDCCPTSVSITSEGPIVAYRDRSAKEVRDIYVSRLVAGRWTAPLPVHRDNWEIEACPVNGPAVSARGRTVVVAWFTAVNDAGRAWAALSRDGGRTFGQPVRLDDAASTGHVGVELLQDGAAIASWVEFANERSQFRVRRVESDGSRSVAVPVAGTGEGRIGGIPRIAASRNQLVLAWTETANGASRVKTARASMPAAAVR
jgi:hypothetical protein